MNCRTVYSSDLHGNSLQYQKLVGYACAVNADVLVLGGDLFPKGLPLDEFVSRQRAFLREELPALLSPFGALPEKKILCTMGNDDCEALIPDFEELSGSSYFSIMQRRVPLHDNFEIVGYPYVPIHPFKMKDWQKFDLSSVPRQWEKDYDLLKRANYRHDGWRTTTGAWAEFCFDPVVEHHDSLQRDLEQDLFTRTPRKTIYVLHSPPFQTGLDMTSQGEHVGSIAERVFIERYQPYLTLHGHIHETVSMSGRFQERIGSSWCLSSGNHHVGDTVALLDIPLENPADTKRVMV
ncbi:metallophosphoesterase [Candidatus Woesearchaeota archaeon]|nr:metallophosphoesterase [Candidatus Woesearchaeota archaeon]